MNYKSFENLFEDISHNISSIPKDVDLVVGVPRSGLLVATIISLLINKPLTDLNGLFENRIIGNGTTKNKQDFINDVHSCKKILIVEDSVATGNSIIKCKETINGLGLSGCDFIYLAAYVTQKNKDLVDIYFEVVEWPRLFQWNLFHNKTILEKTCFDIDGVLCSDPSESENDDGERYINFIKTAKPKLVPSCRIGYVVSSRLLKYQEETKQWLVKNGINYDELFMLDSTAKERKEKNLHATFKAEIYKRLKDSVLFVESDESQAKEINRITKKPVYCFENNTMYQGSLSYAIKKENKFKNILKKIPFVRKIYSKIKHK